MVQMHLTSKGRLEVGFPWKKEAGSKDPHLEEEVKLRRNGRRNGDLEIVFYFSVGLRGKLAGV